jgi:hypothetical protein
MPRVGVVGQFEHRHQQQGGPESTYGKAQAVHAEERLQVSQLIKGTCRPRDEGQRTVSPDNTAIAVVLLPPGHNLLLLTELT